jgi:hypothetical protein
MKFRAFPRETQSIAPIKNRADGVKKIKGKEGLKLKEKVREKIAALFTNFRTEWAGADAKGCELDGFVREPVGISVAEVRVARGGGSLPAGAVGGGKTVGGRKRSQNGQED